jgi:MtN3 and saliva related transmembrane protein
VTTELVGWLSAGILMLTISRQVYKQWSTRDCTGVSSWLFIGQTAASTGFVIYSFMLSNWVFVLTNSFILLTAVVGQWIYARNKRLMTAHVEPALHGGRAQPRPNSSAG